MVSFSGLNRLRSEILSGQGDGSVSGLNRLCSVLFPIQLRNQLIFDKMIFVGFAAAGPCVAAAENMQ